MTKRYRSLDKDEQDAVLGLILHRMTSDSKDESKDKGVQESNEKKRNLVISKSDGTKKSPNTSRMDRFRSEDIVVQNLLPKRLCASGRRGTVSHMTTLSGMRLEHVIASSPPTTTFFSALQSINIPQSPQYIDKIVRDNVERSRVSDPVLFLKETGKVNSKVSDLLFSKETGTANSKTGVPASDQSAPSCLSESVQTFCWNKAGGVIQSAQSLPYSMKLIQGLNTRSVKSASSNLQHFNHKLAPPIIRNFASVPLEQKPQDISTQATNYPQESNYGQDYLKVQMKDTASSSNNISLPFGFVKHCAMENCQGEAVGRSPYCLIHKGVRRCEREGCIKCAQGKTRFCIKHGGGRRCSVEGCPRSARDRSLCTGHGGGRRCSRIGCPKSAVGRGKECTAHGGGKRCGVENCNKSAQSGTDHCVRHGGGRKCDVEHCSRVSRGRTSKCMAHAGLSGILKNFGNNTPILCKDILPKTSLEAKLYI